LTHERTGTTSAFASPLNRYYGCHRRRTSTAGSKFLNGVLYSSTKEIIMFTL
jgi:hypothetical protein